MQQKQLAIRRESEFVHHHQPFRIHFSSFNFCIYFWEYPRRRLRQIFGENFNNFSNYSYYFKLFHIFARNKSFPNCKMENTHAEWMNEWKSENGRAFCIWRKAIKNEREQIHRIKGREISKSHVDFVCMCCVLRVVHMIPKC